MLHWSDYIFERETEGVKCIGDVFISIECLVYCYAGVNGVELGDVLQFLTGAKRIPASGFGTALKVKFTNEVKLPVVSTCDCSITFSRSWGTMDENKFKNRLSECILCCRLWTSIQFQHSIGDLCY